MVLNFYLFFVGVHISKCSDLSQINRFTVSKSDDFIKGENKLKRVGGDFTLIDSARKRSNEVIFVMSACKNVTSNQKGY